MYILRVFVCFVCCSLNPPTYDWWLVRVTLVVAFGFLPQNVGRWREVQVQWWRYHEVVETLKPYLIQKNLFEILALTGGGDRKTSDMSTHAITHTLATW